MTDILIFNDSFDNPNDVFWNTFKLEFFGIDYSAAASKRISFFPGIEFKNYGTSVRFS